MKERKDRKGYDKFDSEKNLKKEKWNSERGRNKNLESVKYKEEESVQRNRARNERECRRILGNGKRKRKCRMVMNEEMTYTEDRARDCQQSGK